MKSLLKILFLLVTLTSFSQEHLEKKDSIKVDFLGNSYHIINGHTLLKQNGNNENSYRNFALGKITSLDILNPLEIVLFYRDFNTAIVLDNFLNEIQVVSFDDTILFINKSIVNKLWVYNSDQQKLQLFDFKSKTFTLSSQPITDFEPIKMESDFNSVKLIGNNKTLTFNQYLSLENTINHQKNN